MQVRRATSADAPAIAAVHVAASRAAYQGLLPEEFLAQFTVERRETGWRQSLENGECEVWIAEEDGQALGWLCTGKSRDPDTTPGTVELWAMYVAPSRWRQGIGRALWNEALPQVMAAGSQSITLWVLEANAPAIAFYRTLGFVEDPDSRRMRPRGGVEVAEVRLRSSLRG